MYETAHVSLHSCGRVKWAKQQSCMHVCVQGLRAALNAALFRTGDQSKDFAVVLATNRPADLDPAVLDRMDEALEFPLPGQSERKRILQIYLDSYIAKAGSAEGDPSLDTMYFFAHGTVDITRVSLKVLTHLRAWSATLMIPMKSQNAKNDANYILQVGRGLVPSGDCWKGYRDS